MLGQALQQAPCARGLQLGTRCAIAAARVKGARSTGVALVLLVLCEAKLRNALANTSVVLVQRVVSEVVHRPRPAHRL